MCLDFPSTKAEMTFPKALSDRLIFVASFKRSPVAPVLACRSDPAKSTRFSFPLRIVSLSFSLEICSMLMVKMLCDRELTWFMSVEAIMRFFDPTFSSSSHSATLWTGLAVRPEILLSKNSPHALGRRPHFVTGNGDSFVGNFFQVQIGGNDFVVGQQQVPYLLVVDLQVADHGQVFDSRGHRDGFEDVVKRPRDDAPLAGPPALGSFHAVRLAAPRLAVHEYRAVVPLQNALKFSNLLLSAQV